MSVLSVRAAGREAVAFPTDGGVIEVPLLLPGWQARALEAAAHARGLTTGEMLRQLLREFLSESRAE